MSFRSSGEHVFPSGLGTPAFLFCFVSQLIHVSLPLVDSAPTTTVLRFMSLETGGAHPLAKLPDLRLDTQLPVSLLDVRADVIGDQIVLVLVDLRTEAPESDAIYLVDWRQGLMTLVRLRHPSPTRSCGARPHPNAAPCNSDLSASRSTAHPTERTRAPYRCSRRSLCSS